MKTALFSPEQRIAIDQYIEKHGFGMPKLPLNQALSADDFRRNYYDKQELIGFCRLVGIPSVGLKDELSERIAEFLATGTIPVVNSKKQPIKYDSEIGLTLEQRVVNYKSDRATRAFFEKHIPQFTGFSALVQKQIKQRLSDDERFTYSDVLDMHREFLAHKISGKAKGIRNTVAHKSCQYNQFSIDYSHDSKPKIHSLIEAWNLVRNSAGAKTYQRYQQRIGEILLVIAN